MRIADILFQHLAPGDLVVDLTPDSPPLSTQTMLPTGFDLRYERALPPAGADRPARALVLRRLRDGDVDPRAVAAEVVQIVFFERIQEPVESGLLETAARGGWELASAHVTQTAAYPFAAVLVARAAAGHPAESNRLRIVGEYRWGKLLLRVREQEIERLQHDLERSEARARRDEEELRRQLAAAAARTTALEQELLGLKQTYQQLARAHEEARAAAADQRERAARLQAQVERLEKRLVSARRSIAFRMGRATRVAMRESGKNPVAAVRRWIDTFRGPDEVLAELAETLPARAPSGPAVAEGELHAIARRHHLAGLEQLRGPVPGVAGIAGPALAAELGVSARFRLLPPDAWIHVLEVEPAAFVLVTSDGLAPGTAWGDAGTPGGRSGADQVRDLVEWCQGRGIPVAWWDTFGLPRARLGMPRGARFDAVFTVNPALCDGGREPAIRPLAPAVEPVLYNPAGVAPTPPRHPLFAGSFDRRLGPAATRELEALLVAALPHGLVILDAHWRYHGPAAEAVRFPAALEAACRPRPALAAELRAAKIAGTVLVEQPSAQRFPAWQLLRSIALGTHVVTTGGRSEDARLAEHVSAGADPAAALAAVAGRPRLDAAWRGAFERILDAYALRDRLDAIARACGAPAVALARPSVGLIARVRSASELDGLRRFVGALAARPCEVRVLHEDGLDPVEALAEVAGGRVAAVSSSEPRAARFLAAGDATHLLVWRPDAPEVRDAVTEVALCARLSEADLVALAPGAPGRAVWAHATIERGALLAVRREAVARHVAIGLDPDPAAILEALEAEGARGFVEGRAEPDAREPAPRRGVA